MICGNRCAGAPNKPSGHTQLCCNSGYTPPCTANVKFENAPQGHPDGCSGPYKDFKPPGCRAPAVGEQEWGDVPYLPSYLDPMNSVQGRKSGPPDSLYTRGPFFKGVSETQEQFANRNGISPRKYYEFTRHYEEPGMKHDKSITQTDFVPPHPMLPKDKSPCLPQPAGESEYVPKRQRPKNPHAKELEFKSSEPEVIYVDDEPKQDFSTEHTDNYVCFQKSKPKKMLKDVIPPEKELFLERLHRTHEGCPHGLPHEFLCYDGDKYETAKARGTGRKDKTCERTPWLLFPRNYSFPNGYLMLPSKSKQQPSCCCCCAGGDCNQCIV